MVGTHLTDSPLLRMLVHEELAQQMREVARIDLHRAGGGTETVCGTRLFTEIAIGFLHLREPFRILTGLSEAEHLPLRGNAHP